MKVMLYLNRTVAVLMAAGVCFAFQSDKDAEVARWGQQARNITIIRDDWGIAHVYGKTDADTVFGAIYAQAEDDFNRVETNYINAMGRLAEAEGETKIYQDLRMKLFIDSNVLKSEYAASPEWLKKLMNSFADGLNYFLLKHPEVQPRVIKRFEPWMALSFTEGSIGGDMERISIEQLKAFYDKSATSAALRHGAPPNRENQRSEPTGSNGIAIAPSNTSGRHALLLINPHTSFFFRSELQMVSDEGLQAYGAATWGQFFIYQGFNNRTGWMHTSSGVDAVDEYLETVVKKGDRLFYKYGNEYRPLTTTEIIVPYRTSRGLTEKKFTVYRTHHGPIIRETNDKWVSVKLMQKPVAALTQSYLRTKAKNYKAYLQTMDLKANSSNNTVFADADGNIAYFHGNFIPRRDPAFDWTKPVDGSSPSTEWRGLLSVEETPHLLNPKSGWLYNTNNWPWSSAGESSPKRENFPPYVESGSENARGLHAIRILEKAKKFTLDSLVSAAYDAYLPWFEKPIAALVKAWDDTPADNSTKKRLAGQIQLLRAWDLRWAVSSVPTSLAVFWAEELRPHVEADAKASGLLIEEYIGSRAPAKLLLQYLSTASDKLEADFGRWKTPWGEINRFQRLTGSIIQPFDDSAPSTPVGFTSGLWGSLAAFGARAYPNTKKWYGTSGNSFVAVVEFGNRVRARAVTAGGESGSPSSPHFNDQAERYSTGGLREVYFYRSQLKGHTQREYQPGN